MFKLSAPIKSMIVNNECDLDIWFSDYQLNNTTIYKK